MENKNILFKKIAYFDEQASMDLLLEKNSGVLETTVKKAKELAASLEVGGKAESPKLLNKLFNFNLSGNAKGTASNIAQTQIKSTILTEFLKLAADSSNLFFDETCSLEITDDSLAYIRSAGKYLKMFKSGENLGPELEGILNTIKIDDLDKILDQASGYYRMIGNYNGSQCIIRFNFEGIRNNYKLTDLPKMNLRIIGIKVGQTSTLDIGMESELDSFAANNESKTYDTFQTYRDINVIDSNETINSRTTLNRYSIIDALIAGVE